MRLRHFATVLSVLLPLAAHGAVTDDQARRYIGERLWVTGAEGATADLRGELESEIVRLLDRAEAGGRLRAHVAMVGYTGSWICFGHPGEQVQTLADALPWLTAATRERVRSWLAADIRAYDPTLIGFSHGDRETWGAVDLIGNRREYGTWPVPPDPDPVRPNIWPPVPVPPETIYMVWRYCDATGDWGFIDATRRARLRSLFAAIPATPTRYGQISGAIGWARILEREGRSGDAEFATAVARVRAGIEAGVDFDAFLETSYRSFIPTYGQGGHDWAFTPFHFARQQNAVGIHLAPEVGRLLRDHALAAVRRRVSSNPDEGAAGQPYAIEAHWPDWFAMRGSYPDIRLWVGHYGENHMVTPDTPWALHLIHAYVYRDDGATMRRMLDVPYGIGDLCHLQRLVACIRAHGVWTWSATPPSGNQPPTVATATAATLDAARIGAALSARGADDGGEAALTYTWSTAGTPPATVAVAPNGSNAARDATATFVRAGSYTLRCTIRDAGGLSATSDVTVSVPQRAAALWVTP